MSGWTDLCRCYKLWNMTNTREVKERNSSLGLPEGADLCPYLCSTLDETDFRILMPREKSTNIFFLNKDTNYVIILYNTSTI